jgi:hypothetical protein
MSGLAGFRGCVEVRPGFVPVTGIRQVVFDWDGTLSFVRAGWAEVMRDQWLEVLPAVAGESESERRQRVHGEIWRLNGRPSIHQAARLSEWVAERGGTPHSALEYENQYQQRLGAVIASRCSAARAGLPHPDAWVVPGARQLLEFLSARHIAVHVLSGTQRRFVVEEARVLGLEPFFGDRIYGPTGPDDREFTKRATLERILGDAGLPSSALLAFGDGQVEMVETKALGGTAVALATDESQFGSGKLDEAKRLRLMGLGADVCLPDFLDLDGIQSLWFS